MATYRSTVRKDATRGTLPADLRLAKAALYTPADDVAALPGVLSGLVVSGIANTWAYAVSGGHSVTVRSSADGANDPGLDGTTNTPTVPAAPSSGSRWDLIWIRQRDVDNGDADSNAVLGVTSGLPSGTPTKPYADVPPGALVLDEAQVGAGATGTLHANVVITRVAAKVGLRGGIIANPTTAQQTALNAIAAANPIWIDTNGTLSRSTGSGFHALGETVAAAVTMDGIATTGSDLWTSLTGSVTISAGTWLVKAGVSVYNDAVADIAACAIRNNSTSSEVANSRGAPGQTLTGGALTNLESRMTVITVTGDTVLMPMAHPNGGSRLAFRTANMAGGPSGWITATRIGF